MYILFPEASSNYIMIFNSFFLKVVGVLKQIILYLITLFKIFITKYIKEENMDSFGDTIFYHTISYIGHIFFPSVG